MPRLFAIGAFTIYVYVERGNPHKAAHCHVRGKGVTTVVSIPMQTILAGPDLPRQVRKELESRMAEVMDAWERLNSDSDTEKTDE